MKRLLWLSFIVVFILGCAGKSHQIQTTLIEHSGIDSDKALQDLSGALQFKTISYSDSAATETPTFLKLFDYMDKTYPLVSSNLKPERINNLALLYTWPGKNPDLAPVLLLSHTDVVPADTTSASRWSENPFDGTIKDNVLWGRGSVDDKCGVIGILEAVEYLLSQGYEPERTILLSFGFDEEIGGEKGAKFLAQTLRDRGVKPGMILDEGGAIVTEGVPGVKNPVALVGIAEKGYVSLELSVEGTGGHSSMPPRETAVTVLSKAVAAISDHPMPAALAGPIREMMVTLAPESAFPFNFLFSNLWLFGGIIEGQLAGSPKSNALIRTTTAPTMFNAGTKDNLLPQKATAVVNFRIKPGDTVEGIIAHVKKVIDNPDISVKVIGDFPQEPSDVSQYHSGQFEAVAKSIRQTFPDVIVSPYLTVGGTDAIHYQGMTDQIYRFLPVQFEGDQLDGMHGIDEHISRDQFDKFVLFYLQLIHNSTGPERMW